MATVPASFFNPLPASFLDRRAIAFFLPKVRIETAALDHEAVDDTVENETVVKAVLHILQEIGHSFWRLVGVKFDAYRADAGLKFNHRVSGKCLGRPEQNA
jgi:hypothetical protein